MFWHFHVHGSSKILFAIGEFSVHCLHLMGAWAGAGWIPSTPPLPFTVCHKILRQVCQTRSVLLGREGSSSWRNRPCGYQISCGESKSWSSNLASRSGLSACGPPEGKVHRRVSLRKCVATDLVVTVTLINESKSSAVLGRRRRSQTRQSPTQRRPRGHTGWSLVTTWAWNVNKNCFSPRCVR